MTSEKWKMKSKKWA